MLRLYLSINEEENPDKDEENGNDKHRFSYVRLAQSLKKHVSDYNRIMEQKVYHGPFEPQDIAQELIAFFNRGNYQVQQFGEGDQIAIQVATTRFQSSGGQTAFGISIQKFQDGISVSMGQQAWLGVAASLGLTALAALRNPLSLLGRLDDVAQDVESLQLQQAVWQVIDDAARSMGSGFELSNRLRRIACLYCNTANPPGESNCIACGAPLGDIQPVTCKNCGYIIKKAEKNCPNCGKPL